MRRFAFFILTFFLLIGLVGGGVLVWGFAQYIKPGPTISENTVFIPEGSSVDSIAKICSNFLLILNMVLIKFIVLPGVE